MYTLACPPGISFAAAAAAVFLGFTITCPFGRHHRVTIAIDCSNILQPIMVMLGTFVSYRKLIKTKAYCLKKDEAFKTA